MEFMMTYGWAIMVILAAIGALAYFGVFSADQYLPDRCAANPPFGCAQYKVAGGNISIWLLNNGGFDMGSVTVSVTCPDASAATVQTGVNASGLPLANGNTQFFGFTCTSTPAGVRWKGSYSVTYIAKCDATPHTTTGVLQARAD